MCVFDCDRSVEEEDGEAGLHPSVHQTALDSSLWTKRERESMCVCVCVCVIRASGLLCPLEIKDLKWNLKTERTLARPKSLEREREGERERGNGLLERKKRENAQACERKETRMKDSLRYLWRVSQLFNGLLNSRTRGFLLSRSGLNNCYMKHSHMTTHTNGLIFTLLLWKDFDSNYMPG